jgi:hypothetical protein
MCVATSTIIAVSVAGASIASQQLAAKKARDAARAAAATQQTAADEALGLQKSQYAQSRADFSPYQTAGAGAMSRLATQASAPTPSFRPGQPPQLGMPQGPPASSPMGASPAPLMSSPPAGAPGQLVMMQGPDGAKRPVPPDVAKQLQTRGFTVVANG